MAVAPEHVAGRAISQPEHIGTRMIPQRNLSLISNKLAEGGGTRIPEKVIELDYYLAWFLIGLYRSELGKHLAFKGGTALRRCHFGEYRFSEDLDFTLLKPALDRKSVE